LHPWKGSTPEGFLHNEHFVIKWQFYQSSYQSPSYTSCLTVFICVPTCKWLTHVEICSISH
jgi:hypothetical protein